MTTDDAPLLEIVDLCVDLPSERGYVRVLDHVSLSVGAGEFLGLAGESGSGKTMTALSTIGLLPSRSPRISGRVQLRGEDLLTKTKRQMRKVRGTQIGMVFQEPMSSLHPAWTVGEQIAEAVRAHRKVSRDKAWGEAVEMLDRVGIPNPAALAKQYSFQFSGGMQQRAMMAIALVNRPALLIADEPTTALDVTIQAQIVELITEVQAELGMAVLFVTHDLGLLAGLAERMVIMYAGQVIENAPTSALFDHPLHPYAQALIQAAPHPELKGTRLPSIPGAPPRPGALPAGCRFHPRCKHAERICIDSDIELEAVAQGRQVRCIRHRTLELTAEVEEVTA